MPIYEYACNGCEHTFDQRVPVSERDGDQECPVCGEADSKRKVSAVNFNLPGDGWAGKNNRIANQMRRKNERLKRREDEMKRDAPNVKLAPNVDGERVDSWSEAAKLAKSKGKDATGYEKKAREEKATR